MLELAENAAEHYFKKAINELNKTFRTRASSGITLTNNEIQYIAKVIRSLENRGLLLKGIARTNNSQEGGLLNFIAPWRKVSLPFMKDVLKQLAESILALLGLTAAVSATNAYIEKEIFGPGKRKLIISNK